MAISQILDMSFKITTLGLQPFCPGANELMTQFVHLISLWWVKQLYGQGQLFPVHLQPYPLPRKSLDQCHYLGLNQEVESSTRF